jgi:hypothetical protein
MIEESQMWWYWPQVPWEQLGYMRGAMLMYPDGYQAIWDGFDGITQDGENITRDQVNETIDAQMGTIWEIEEGFLRSDAPIVEYIYDLGLADLASRDEDEPADYEKLSNQILGYMVWQWYRLDLAMQGSKLTQFGRRGRVA